MNQWTVSERYAAAVTACDYSGLDMGEAEAVETFTCNLPGFDGESDGRLTVVGYADAVCAITGDRARCAIICHHENGEG